MTNASIDGRALRARVLVVDDEVEIRAMLETRLSFTGHEVWTAGDGLAALEVLGERRIDVVVSDISMPRMDGLELLARIRAEYPMTRVVMMTGYVTLENAMACMRRGALTCIFKPLEDLTEMERAIARAVEDLLHWQEKLRTLQGMKPRAVR